jgi:glycerophosphoryl diester phosphodiesterase
MRRLFPLVLLSGLLAASPAPAPFDLQGHRGCRGLMPENTVPAMRRALDLGVTTLEMDLAISQDRQVLLSHDPYLNAAFVLRPDGQPLSEADGKARRLFGLPYADIRRYDVGSKPYPKFPRQQKLRTYKPLLAEVIDSAEAYAHRKHRPAPRYNLETKTTPAGDGQLHPGPEEFVRLVLAVVQQKGIGARTTLQSFDPRTLEVAHRLAPTLPTALLVENRDGLEANLRRLSFRPAIYSPQHQLVTAELVQACHRQGLLVIPWTVNTAAKAAPLRQLQVDGLITDYPDVVRAARP